jgi:hypothetical protein
MQAASDIFLGWQRIKGFDSVTRDYCVRQLPDWKGSVDVDRLLVPGATVHAHICGATLARAHLAGAIGSLSRRTSAGATFLLARSPISRRPMRTRTNMTTLCSLMR